MLQSIRSQPDSGRSDMHNELPLSGGIVVGTVPLAAVGEMRKRTLRNVKLRLLRGILRRLPE